MLVLSAAIIGFLYTFKCGFSLEVKSYSKYRPNAYYFGQKYCPATWKLKSITKEEIEKLPSENKVEILSQKEDLEIERVLTEKFLGYNKFNTGEGRNIFYIYETICKQCELN